MKIPALCWVVLAAGWAFAQDAPRPRILGVAHIALSAHDLEKSTEFYRDVLGFQQPYSLNKPDGSPSMYFFKINERQYIELSPESESGTDRLKHISLETDDAEGLRRYLASRGVKVPDKVGKGRTGNSNFNVVDPDGHTVEMVQYERDGWTIRERGKFVPNSRVATHMSHVGIIVTALEPSLKFYRDILGMRETWRGGRDSTVLSWVNLQVPDGQDYIELMLYRDAPAPTQRGTAHHLCLEVEDLPATVKKLEANPNRSKYSKSFEMQTGINRKRQLNLFDPDTTRTELMEFATVDGVPPQSSTAPPPR